MIRTETFILKVRDEPVGVAYGEEQWYRAQEFLKIPLGLPTWIDESVWDSLIVVRKRLDAEPSLRDIAKGSTGFGDDSGPED